MKMDLHHEAPFDSAKADGFQFVDVAAIDAVIGQLFNLIEGYELFAGTLVGILDLLLRGRLRVLVFFSFGNLHLKCFEN